MNQQLTFREQASVFKQAQPHQAGVRLSSDEALVNRDEMLVVYQRGDSRIIMVDPFPIYHIKGIPLNTNI